VAIIRVNRCPNFGLPGLLELRASKIFKCLCEERTDKLKLAKAAGLDGLTARLFRNTAPVIAKPIKYLVNLTMISTGVTPSE